MRYTMLVLLPTLALKFAAHSNSHSGQRNLKPSRMRWYYHVSPF